MQPPQAAQGNRVDWKIIENKLLKTTHLQAKPIEMPADLIVLWTITPLNSLLRKTEVANAITIIFYEMQGQIGMVIEGCTPWKIGTSAIRWNYTSSFFFRFSEELDNDISLHNIAENMEQINLSGYNILLVLVN